MRICHSRSFVSCMSTRELIVASPSVYFLYFTSKVQSSIMVKFGNCFFVPLLLLLAFLICAFFPFPYHTTLGTVDQEFWIGDAIWGENINVHERSLSYIYWNDQSHLISEAYKSRIHLGIYLFWLMLITLLLLLRGRMWMQESPW